MTSDRIDPVTFARTIRDRTDDEVFAFVAGMDMLDSKSRANDRIAHDRILRDVNRRARELLEVVKVGCSATECRYRHVVGLIPGVDVSIDGDVWPGSPYAQHIDRCPWHQAYLMEKEAVAAANAGARSVFCPKCERGHDGPCTGPVMDPAIADTISRVRAFQHVANEHGFGRPQQ